MVRRSFLVRSLNGVLSFAALFLAFQSFSAEQKATLSLAAAADLRYALDEVIEKFESLSRSPVHVQVSYGSTGNFVTQILQNAPFDLFLAADSKYTQLLISKGMVDQDQDFHYAKGKLVLWVSKHSHLNLESLGMNALLSPEVKRIAIANPDHAPYGKAAVEALQSSGKYEEVKDRLVRGENVAQAAQFVLSESSQIGIIALSLARSEKLSREGWFWMLPEKYYTVLDQAGVILKHSHVTGHTALAYEFRTFLMGEKGQEILKKNGLASR